MDPVTADDSPAPPTLPQNRRSRRIIHIARRFTPQEWGGTETVILEIARAQSSAGWRPQVATSMALSGKPNEVWHDLPIKRFAYCYPYARLAAAEKAALDKKGGNLVSPSLFFWLLCARRVRVFHAHALGRLAAQVRTVARLRKKPYVVSLHGGVFDLPPEQIRDLLSPVAHKLDWGKPIGAVLGSRRVLQDADQVICVGLGEFEQARKRLDHDRIAYLPNGVNPERFASGAGARFRAKYGIPPQALLLATLSRIDRQKNQLVLLEAFARLRRRRPQCFLLLAGPETQPDYAAALRRFIGENQLEPSVRFLPGFRYDDPDLVDAYHACDVFVLPSRHEPFGIVVLEAWSCGKPVVASAVGGLRGLIDHGATGLLFNPLAPDAPAELGALLEQLASNPERRRQLGESGRAAVHAQYRWSQIARRLEAIYAAAEEHRSRPRLA